MANIQLLNGAEKIKDSYGKINTSLTNLNNDKLEKSGGVVNGLVEFANGKIQIGSSDGIKCYIRFDGAISEDDQTYHTLWNNGNNIFSLTLSGGYLKLANDLIFQWGAPILADGGSVVFPITFPRECFIILPIAKTNAKVWTENEMASGFTLRHDQGANPVPTSYFAIGW